MDEKKITFKFVRPDHVAVKPVNAFWVYESERGLLVDLCLDRPRPTTSVTYSVMTGGQLGPQVGSAVAEEVVREIVASVDIAPQRALELGKYLVEAAKKRGAIDPEAGNTVTSDKVH